MIDSSGSEFRNAEVRTESGRALRCSRLHLRVFGDVIGDGQLAISTGPLGVDRTLGNALAVLVRKPLLGTCCKRGELAVVISAISNGLWNTWFSLRRGPAIASAWLRRNVRQTAGSDTPTANDRRNLLIAQRRADDVHSGSRRDLDELSYGSLTLETLSALICLMALQFCASSS